MQQIFEENSTEVLRGAIIWIPMLETDSLDAADQREISFSDGRLAQVWDADRIFGRLLSQTLSLHDTIAWDVYLVYPPDTVWDAHLPPMPELWMHQQPDEEPTHWLNPSRLKEHISTLLERKDHR